MAFTIAPICAHLRPIAPTAMGDRRCVCWRGYGADKASSAHAQRASILSCPCRNMVGEVIAPTSKCDTSPAGASPPDPRPTALSVGSDRPPVTPAGARAIHIVRRVDVIHAAVTAGWDLPLCGRFRVEVHAGATRLAAGTGGWRPAGASSRVAGGRRATDVGRPGGIVRDQSAAGVSMPALGAMQRAV